MEVDLTKPLRAGYRMGGGFGVYSMRVCMICASIVASLDIEKPGVLWEGGRRSP